jgi:hypothetical protein
MVIYPYGGVKLGGLGALGVLSWASWASCEGVLTKPGGLLNLGSIDKQRQDGANGPIKNSNTKGIFMSYSTVYNVYYTIMYPNSDTTDKQGFATLEEAQQFVQKVKNEYKSYSGERVCYLKFNIDKIERTEVYEELVS